MHTPRLFLIAASAVLVSIVPLASPAHAQPPQSSAPAPLPARGLAVLGVSVTPPAAPAAAPPAAQPAPASPVPLGDTPAWKLARGVYADASLRPAFDEAHARALAGEVPAASAPGDVRDLAETRAGIHGDDGPSRRLLASLAAQLHVRGVIVVFASAAPAPGVAPVMAGASAKVFLAGAGQFDAASYAPDPSGEWGGAVSSLSRAYGASTVTLVGGDTTLAPVLAGSGALTPPPPAADSRSHAFYLSPWFWGAIGAAALGGVAVYFATKDSDPSTIHLQLTLPR